MPNSEWKSTTLISSVILSAKSKNLLDVIDLPIEFANKIKKRGLNDYPEEYWGTYFVGTYFYTVYTYTST